MFYHLFIVLWTIPIWPFLEKFYRTKYHPQFDTTAAGPILPRSNIRIISLRTQYRPTRPLYFVCSIYEEYVAASLGLNSVQKLHYWDIHRCVHLGPFCPSSSIIFRIASDAISVIITNGSNAEVDLYDVKKECPCRRELKPLLSKVVVSSSSASQDASIRPVNIVPRPPPRPNVLHLWIPTISTNIAPVDCRVHWKYPP